MATRASSLQRLMGAFLAAAAILAATAPALAHHTPGHGIAWMGPTSMAGQDVEVAAFDLSESGSYVATATKLEYAVLPKLSLLARIPVAWIDYDDGRTASGLADIEVGGKLALLERDAHRVLLSTGMSVEMPTGDHGNGLGGGHWEVSPQFAASAEPFRGFLCHLVLSDLWSVGEDEGSAASALRFPSSGREPPGAGGYQGHEGHDHEDGPIAHGSVLSPHTSHEASLQFVAAYARGRAYVSAGSEFIHVWSDGSNDPWIGRTEAGVVLTPQWMLVAGFDAPLAGEERFERRGRLGLTWRLGGQSESNLGDPVCSCH